jgi:hypothetical protein
MHAIPHHLEDEHMQFYEWSGAVAGMQHAALPRSKRNHPWHASYAVLALLTSLLIVNGCDSKGPAAKAGEQVGKAREDEAGKLVDDATAEPGPGRSPDDARGQTSETLQKP